MWKGISAAEKIPDEIIDGRNAVSAALLTEQTAFLTEEVHREEKTREDKIRED